MSALPAISVIATVRNERGGIHEFVESLLAQTLAPDEVIIVDGASTDGTLEILREYERAGRIRLISQPCNIAEGRNLGVRAARNERIAATDAGCRADPDWLERIARAFASAEQPDVVAANYAFDTRSEFELASVLATDPPDRERSEQGKYYPSSRSIGFTKRAWAAAKGYPEWLYAAEDTLFNIRLRQLGFRFAFARDALVRWRPRTTWKGLVRQHFNYGRGNGRIGLGLAGYRVSLQYYGLAALLVAAGFLWPLAWLGAALVLAQHARRNLLQQARHARQATGLPRMFWRTLAVMQVVRLASLAGFLAGRWDRIRDPRFVRAQIDWMGTASVEDPPLAPAWSSGVMLLAIPLLAWAIVARWGLSAAGPAGIVTVALAVKSLKDFSRTGPQLKDEILHHYVWYSLFAFLRLAGWAFVLCLLMAGAGLMVAEGLAGLLAREPAVAVQWLAGLAGIGIVSGYQFCRHLLHIPGSIAASSNYRLSRLYPLWRLLSPARLNAAGAALAIVFAGSGLATAGLALRRGAPADGALLIGCLACYALLLLAATGSREPKPRKARPGIEPGLNLLLIGADTLRADRLGIEGYPRALTPALDALAARGAYLAQCFIPCGRTAPSLASLLTGTWPHTHGIRDNFSLPSEFSLRAPSLAEALANAGYETVAISDWAGADLGKYPFGFARRLLPSDQWNIKYLIRQGPKDLRLFLSLFTHSRFGRRFLPELYYLAGVPMTDELGRATRRAISECAASGRPFLINAFLSTTHAPFASEYPYYTLFAGHDYAGPSKFVMGLMNDPFEIIKQQRHTAGDFDLRQVHALYDGCVRRFDDEVGRILDHLEACGLRERTIVVAYADHGIEFFERDSWGQGNSVIVDGSSRIPLIVADPRRAGPVRVAELTRNIDVAPTLLELLGLPVPEAMEGVSLKRRLDGSGAALDLLAFEETGIWFTRIPGLPEGHLHYPELPVLLEIPDKASGTLSIKPEYRERVLQAKDRAVRSDRWKLVYMPMASGTPRIALFDLLSDPDCARDVAAAHPAVVAALAAALRQWIPPGEAQTTGAAPAAREPERAARQSVPAFPAAP
jgi:arylsulfatase A-like enzyme/glycosyltransferase involved in cell wall biosynthesis